MYLLKDQKEISRKILQSYSRQYLANKNGCISIVTRGYKHYFQCTGDSQKLYTVIHLYCNGVKWSYDTIVLSEIKA